jgi:hypothetical protein
MKAKAKKETSKEETIVVPIYFYMEGKKIVIDIEGIRDEFDEMLGEVVANPRKFLEV